MSRGCNSGLQKCNIHHSERPRAVGLYIFAAAGEYLRVAELRCRAAPRIALCSWPRWSLSLSLSLRPAARRAAGSGRIGARQDFPAALSQIFPLHIHQRHHRNRQPQPRHQITPDHHPLKPATPTSHHPNSSTMDSAKVPVKLVKVTRVLGRTGTPSLSPFRLASTRASSTLHNFAKKKIE